MLDVVDHRHPTHHGLLSKLGQRLKAKVVKLLVPAPCFIFSACGETEWSRHLEVDIEVVGPATDLDEKTDMLIQNQ